MTTRFALRAATDDIHRELDDRLSRLDLSEAADYRRFLRIHARAVPPVEDALARAGLDALVSGWCAGRRGPAIESDLAALGVEMPPPAMPPAIDGVGELLGTAYVLEGSRLGGRVLRRRVADGLPASFLSEPESNPWPALIAVMDRHLYSDALIGEATGAARRCFALFLDVASEAGI
jgi:heme oxygenase